MYPKETAGYFENQRQEMICDLRAWVEIESPTSVKSSVDEFGRAVAAKFADIGMSIEWKRDENRGDHLIARWGSRHGHLLLIGHLDTVWELGTLQRIPCEINDEIGRGPGIFDMKAGLILALYALRLMRDQHLDKYPVTFLATSDEEEGSTGSRELIEQEARSAIAAFVLEPAGPNNSVKTKRRGVGRYTVETHGRAAHAGVEPEKGINAIEELSHQLIEVQSWNRLRNGISVNAGLIQGGTRTNVIPEHAEAIIDVRCDAMDDVKWLSDQFSGLTPKKEGARITVTGGVERPPLERTDKVLRLYQQAKEIGDAMNYSLSEFWTGGGSDGNLTAALGVPTLDGLGAEGGGAHALNEHILTASLPRRAALLYHLILRQFA
ncbi:MAG: M20 family metallopeptidase [Acidobacteriota bacterium]